MQMPSLPLAQDVVLIGGGHTHALLLRMWGMNPLPGARLTVINPAATAPYTGMLPGFVAGHYGRDDLEIDLVRLARFAGARIILGRATGIDRTDRRITLDGHPPIRYDLASIDVGITSAMPELPGFSDHGIAAKPLGPFASRWSAHLAGQAGPVTVIGGGVAGVELAFAMAYALKGRGKVTVIESDTALSGIAHATARRLRDELARQSIDLLEHTKVTEVAADHVALSTGDALPSALTVGSAGARPFRWLSETGLALTDGYLTVGETLQTSDPAIFATGDCAHLSHAPRPKAGVFAVRAAPVLTRNIRAALQDKPLAAFRPQAHYLKLISLGRKAALADKWNRSIGGAWAWRWKDRIDRRFMDNLADLAPMAPPPLPVEVARGTAEALGPKPLCGGCGAKIGPDILSGVLDTLPQTPRADVETGTGDDAAVLNFGKSRQVISTDHLRAFWDDPYTMARIAALHALGDVWAMGAAPQAVLAQISLPRMAGPMQAEWLSEIMTAATEVFAAEHATIAGGHSTLGAELVIGFTVTGIAARRPLTLAGAQAGDALILTRPIGSGTLFAAEMELKAKGDDIAAALAVLNRPQGDAARLLADTAHAMTDVTGFGLAGHLARMAEASNLSAALDLAAIPTFSGAVDLAAQGVRSSIWAGNRAAVSATLAETPIGTLLFDPQTAGGLLAAVPADTAEATRDKLRDMGHEAALVGQMTPKGAVTLTAR